MLFTTLSLATLAFWILTVGLTIAAKKAHSRSELQRADRLLNTALMIGGVGYIPAAYFILHTLASK